MTDKERKQEALYASYYALVGFKEAFDEIVIKKTFEHIKRGLIEKISPDKKINKEQIIVEYHFDTIEVLITDFEKEGEFAHYCFEIGEVI